MQVYREPSFVSAVSLHWVYLQPTNGLGIVPLVTPAFHPLHATHPPLRMVETSLLEQEPEPDIRSLSLRNNHQQQQQPTPFTTENVAQHDDAIQQPRLNPTPIIKEKDFVHLATLENDEKPTVEHKAIFPALTRLRRPYQERDSDGPIRSQSTPPASRAAHVNFSNNANTRAKDDTPSAFATAEPLPPSRLNDVGPPRPPKNIAELFAPDRKLASDPGWTQSFVNTVKCMFSLRFLSQRVLIAF